MNDYIDREAVIAALAPAYGGVEDYVRKVIGKIPAADVAIVRRAHWKEFNSCAAECSKCGGTVSNERLWKKRYCPECGAKMETNKE